MMPEPTTAITSNAVPKNSARVRRDISILLVRNSYLLPLRREGKVQAVQIDIRDRSSNLQGFQGENTTPAEQARLWKARFAPTVLFLGPKGQELAERLVGVAVPDFYGDYLDARLMEARKRLKLAHTA